MMKLDTKKVVLFLGVLLLLPIACEAIALHFYGLHLAIIVDAGVDMVTIEQVISLVLTIFSILLCIPFGVYLNRIVKFETGSSLFQKIIPCLMLSEDNLEEEDF